MWVKVIWAIEQSSINGIIAAIASKAVITINILLKQWQSTIIVNNFINIRLNTFSKKTERRRTTGMEKQQRSWTDT